MRRNFYIYLMTFLRFSRSFLYKLMHQQYHLRRQVIGFHEQTASRTFSKSSEKCRGHIIQDIVDSLQRIDHSADFSFESILSLLDEVKLADVGLNENDLNTFGMLKQRNENLYMPIACSEKFDFAIFIIRRGQRLPLHDHPNMIVISKLLHGKLHLKSFDWVDDPSNNHIGSEKKARCTKDTVINVPAAPWMLFANKGNLHDLYAIETCVILDVLTPPYDATRPCSYYEPLQEPTLNNTVTLKQISEPLGLPRYRPYRGSPVLLKSI